MFYVLISIIDSVFYKKLTLVQGGAGIWTAALGHEYGLFSDVQRRITKAVLVGCYSSLQK